MQSRVFLATTLAAALATGAAVAADPPAAVEADVLIVRIAPAGARLACLAPGQGQRIIDEEQTRRLLVALASNGNGEVIAAPKIMTLDGHVATILNGGEHCWVQAARLTVVNGKLEVAPELGSIDIGTSVTFTPRLSNDRQSVELDLTAQMTELAAEQPAGVPVTAGDNVIVVNAPKLSARSVVQAKRVVPVGATFCLELPRPEGSDPADRAPRVCVLVTPRVCNTAPTAAPPVLPVVATMPPTCLPECVSVTTNNDPPAAQPEPEPVPNRKLAKLMAKYDRACANGDVEKARKWALRCLEIDPTCFGK